MCFVPSVEGEQRSGSEIYREEAIGDCEEEEWSDVLSSGENALYTRTRSPDGEIPTKLDSTNSFTFISRERATHLVSALTWH